MDPGTHLPSGQENHLSSGYKVCCLGYFRSDGVKTDSQFSEILHHNSGQQKASQDGPAHI